MKVLQVNSDLRSDDTAEAGARLSLDVREVVAEAEAGVGRPRGAGVGQAGVAQTTVS